MIGVPRFPWHGDRASGAPPWLVSFGDMMTLILTFFILLVSLSQQRDFGLLAQGLGSFVVALKSHGMPGMLSEEERVSVFDEFRRRFNLPEESDAARRASPADASELELLRATLAEALAPREVVFQPAVAEFEPDSAELSPSALARLERLAATLRPKRGELLVLEGHGGADSLALGRANAVRDWLVRELGFDGQRIEARAWLAEVESAGASVHRVDARVVAPAQEAK